MIITVKTVKSQFAIITTPCSRKCNQGCVPWQTIISQKKGPIQQRIKPFFHIFNFTLTWTGFFIQDYYIIFLLKIQSSNFQKTKRKQNPQNHTLVSSISISIPTLIIPILSITSHTSFSTSRFILSHLFLSKSSQLTTIIPSITIKINFFTKTNSYTIFHLLYYTFIIPKFQLIVLFFLVKFTYIANFFNKKLLIFH